MTTKINIFLGQQITHSKRVKDWWILVDSINKKADMFQNEDTMRQVWETNFGYDYIVKNGAVYGTR